jgi:hypothetical protein
MAQQRVPTATPGGNQRSAGSPFAAAMKSGSASRAYVRGSGETFLEFDVSRERTALRFEMSLWRQLQRVRWWTRPQCFEERGTG